MALPIRLDFNSSPSTVMHIDLNSCFATIEQQANPLLRDKPIVVAAYDTPNGFILAPSVQAKRLGIKVGMNVRQGRLICPELIIRTPDPDKYRVVHLAIKKIVSEYTPVVIPRSIDEFVLEFAKTPALNKGLFIIGQEIKNRIKQEVGDYLTVSIGIGPSRFLAKTASNLHKPDGLDEINKDNFLKIYENLTLTDLNGIATRNAIRLNMVNVYTVIDLYKADLHILQKAFKSVASYYWLMRLRGWEVDNVEWGVKSFGHTYSLPKFLPKKDTVSILSKLVEKVGFRMRGSNYQARGVHLGIKFVDHQYWNQGISLSQPIFLSQDIYKIAQNLLLGSPDDLPVRNLSVSCFNLSARDNLQLGLFEDTLRKESLMSALDDINDRWGSFVIAPALMVGTKGAVRDSISFGNVRSLK